MLQFLLNGLQNLMDGIPMIVAWWLSGVMVAMATIRIEKYFAARRRFQR